MDTTAINSLMTEKFIPTLIRLKEILKILEKEEEEDKLAGIAFTPKARKIDASKIMQWLFQKEHGVFSPEQYGSEVGLVLLLDCLNLMMSMIGERARKEAYIEESTLSASFWDSIRISRALKILYLD
jgi:hypothetical protein